ncbi:hypothetical protein FB567DRAFT_586146 [Paraphoma chrysanthemicola]|uniref:Uncharacterized protein n=1 Tax=Paraphoma chrysanthemicola TaxID=798071 RepID=A0A8K0W4G3_9PLEO|nr:hypothetical protein FB567DRAFT_586146 [Paraphoma chrysanthemicola]
MLAAATHGRVEGRMPELDRLGYPAFPPYGEPLLMSVTKRGPRLQLCVLDLWNAWKEGTATETKLEPSLKYYMEKARIFNFDLARLALVISGLCRRRPKLKND